MEFRPPAKLTLDGNLSHAWNSFKQQFLIYMTASKKNVEEQKVQVAVFLNIIGEEAIELFNTFELSEAQKGNLDSIMQAFEDYCCPRKNETYERFMFFNRHQRDGEPFDHYFTELKKLAKTCNFGTQTDSLIRDRIILGMKDSSLQEKLLRTENLTLADAVRQCRLLEISKTQAKVVQKGVDVQGMGPIADEVKRVKNPKKKMPDKQQYECLKCGTTHSRGNCPAFGKECNYCHGFNHFVVGCMRKKQVNANNTNKINSGSLSTNVRSKRSNKSKSQSQVNEVETEVYIDTISLDNVQTVNGMNAWTTDTEVNGHKIVCKLDTGANCNCMSLKTYKQVKIDEVIEKSNVAIMTYGNNRISCVGSVTFKCFVKKMPCNIKFIIIDADCTPILGLNACIKLGLLQKVDAVVAKSKEEFINKNAEVFEGTGKVPYKYKIVLKKDSVPFVSKCRRVPDSIKPQLKKTLDNLLERGIIDKVEQPTDWVNNIVIVEKPNKSLRICLDPLHLNKSVCLDQFPIPTLDELALKLKGKTMFTVLDLKDGFYQVPLDSDSAKLCTFVTPMGKYCFKRLPFGLNVSPEVFQRINEKLFGDLGIGIYFDDFIIAGTCEEEHDKILEAVIKRAKENGVRFNKNKLQYKVNSVKYLGQVFSADGVQPDPEYINAIMKLKVPANKKELLKIIGMINYLTKYIPRLSDIMLPLRELTKEKVSFAWTENHTDIFNKIKNLITQIPNLKIFDPKLPIEIQTDASLHGIGGCLLQHGQPVAFCSRSLTETEIKYPQIDKEMLGICFSLNKFHHFIYGRKIVVKTDHKPLVAICEKDFYKVSNRLQRLKLKLLRYNIKVEYLPGKLMIIADLLSRSFLKNDEVPEESVVVHSVSIELPISEKTLAKLRHATVEDSNFQLIREYFERGWPEKNSFLNNGELKFFFKVKDELHFNEGLLFHLDKLVVPSSLRHEMLQKLHIGHFGIEKTKARARSIFYWPGLTKAVTNVVSKCESCIKYSRKPVKEPIKQHDRPNIPFYKVAADIMTYGSNDYLVLVDYYSNWIELIKLESKTATEIINKLKVIFTQFGVPKTFMSDNMPFNSIAFKEFADAWEIDIITSSPLYPQSNGLAERAVGICKGILRKCEGDEVHKALLEYRVTPVSGLNVTPSELLQGRILRTQLPCSTQVLKKKVHFDDRKLEEKREKTAKYYNRQARPRKKFNEGDSVVMRKESQWIPAEVIKNTQFPNSFWVRDETGHTYRRNSSFLKENPNKFKEKTECFGNDENDSQNNSNNLCTSPSISSDINGSSENRHTNVNSNSTESYKTRSGRLIVKPIRFKDTVS